MYNHKETTLEAFRVELSKYAAPNWHNIAGGLGALTGAGAAVGGLAGGTAGAVHGYRAARERGEGVGASIAGGLSGAVGSAPKGALLGAGAGALGGAALGHLSPSSVEKLVGGNTPILSGASRFGQRQLHGLTGWTPKGGIESIRGGAYEAKNRVATAKGALEGATSDKARQAAQRELEAAHKGLSAAQTVQDRGMTSIPGIAKAMKTHGVLETLKADAKNQWAGAGAASKALMVGLPAAGVVGSVASADSPNEAGQGKAERIGKSMGQLAGGVVGSAVPIVGQMALGTPLSAAGQMMGRGIDKLRGRPSKKDIQIDPSFSGHLVSGSAASSVPKL